MKKLLSFAGVGLLSTVIDFIVLNVALKLHFTVFIATALGFMAGLTNGYFLNSRYVFATDRNYQRYLKYFTVSFGGLMLTELIVYLLHVRFSHHYTVNQAKIVAVVIVFFWNYGLSTAWAFK